MYNPDFVPPLWKFHECNTGGGMKPGLHMHTTHLLTHLLTWKMNHCKFIRKLHNGYNIFFTGNISRKGKGQNVINKAEVTR